ncbi:hypothetical protein DCS_03902 [Drechmeria coniospora]|uniref:Uncharacterized protein n=1 Tax=Drechmeria coniospora TaxID=98403 RepID=A0A151GII1_DRECN|nr:hypothetical protein DCS_03902 [Drechmeria coniospora]KYK56896.1 hypothetical protein DCS_03902 [Drechmeria coniospora]
MRSICGLNEFYISCNPPLLPAGVNYVVEKTKMEYPNDQIRPGHGSTSEEDVKIMGDSPRVLPWTRLENGTDVDDGRYDTHRFPANMANFRHRAVWRGLESLNGWTVNNFLNQLKSIWEASGAPTTIKELEIRLDCKLSHNLASNLMYVATSSGEETLRKAIQTLGNFIRILCTGGFETNHMILAGSGSFNFAFRWLSHVGQERSTYVSTESEHIADEYNRLQMAVTLRTERLDGKNNDYISGKTRHPFKGGLKIGATKVFGPFDGFEYRKKNATAAFKQTTEYPPGAKKPPKHENPPVENSTVENSTVKNAPVEGSESIRGAPLARSSLQERYVETWRADVERANAEYVGEEWKTRSFQQGQADFDEHGNRKQGSANYIMADFYRTMVSASKPREVIHELNDFEDLICFDRDTETGPNCLPLAEKPMEDLIDLEEVVVQPAKQQSIDLLSTWEPYPTILDTGISQTLQAPLSATVKPGAQMDGFNRCNGVKDEPACFGRWNDDELKILRETMKQRAGRRIGNWSTSRSSFAMPAVETQTSPQGQSNRKNASEHDSMSRSSRDMPIRPRDGPGVQRKISAGEQISDVTLMKKKANLHEAKARVKDMAKILPFLPGRVSIGVKFGRIYVKDVSHSQVDVGTGPNFTMDEMLMMLYQQEHQLGFSTTLSTCGPDMDAFVRQQPRGEPSWLFSSPSTRVSYEFTCYSGVGDAFVVEVDAMTFDYAFISRSTCLDSSPTHAAIGKALVASVSVTSKTDIGIIVETTTDERLGATVCAVRVLHVAEYRQGVKGGSVLSVTMVKRLSPRKRQEKRMQWSLDLSGHRGYPPIFYEASISSVRAKAILEENVDLKFGDSASWALEHLVGDDILEDICRPALGMMSGMDDIGLNNDNGHRLDGRRTFNDTVAEQEERKGKTKFW